MLKPIQILPALLGLFSLLAVCANPLFGAAPTDLEARIRALEQEIASSKHASEVAAGREIYKASCMACHGINGDGKGPSAKRLDPKPRDFTTGLFKWRSTPYGALPTDEDLERSIREGVSGTEMVPFRDILSRKAIGAVAQYIKIFSPKFSDPALQVPPGAVVKIPERRPFEASEASIAKGKELFTSKGCAACHGEEGAGDGPAAGGLVDGWGEPIAPWNFRHAYYKSGTSDQDLYRTIATGLNGTPMISYAAATTEEERWQLVDFLRSVGGAHSSLLHHLFVDEPSGRVYDAEHSSQGL